MKAPLCRLCEHEHWGNQPHVFPDTPSRVVSRSKAVSNVTNSVTNKTEVSAAARRMKKWRDAHAEENRAKQRELMRKRRERARAGSEVVA